MFEKEMGRGKGWGVSGIESSALTGSTLLEMTIASLFADK
jgi:hypothetical protein